MIYVLFPRNSLKLACLLALLAQALQVQAAPGDIVVKVVDMNRQPIPGSQGGRAALMGKDARGVLDFSARTADEGGSVTFSAVEIGANIQGAFGFALYAFCKDSSLRGQLYDPFGPQWTYVRYDPTREYQFILPTPTSGTSAPEITWNGTESRIRFRLDLGECEDKDFWFTRVVIQKKAISLAQAGSDYGINPIMGSAWLQDRGYTVNDSGLAVGQTGQVRLEKGPYDQTFLATKSVSAPGSKVQYILHLVNCTWAHDLIGSYDKTERAYSSTFNPSRVFTDTNAPAWDGLGMKPDVEYFPTFQAAIWIWDSAGASNGLAIAWGPSAAESVLSPVRIPSLPVKLTALSKLAGQFIFQIEGSPARPFTIQCCTDLSASTPWVALQTTNSPNNSFVFVDTYGTATRRFYRVRQP